MNKAERIHMKKRIAALVMFCGFTAPLATNSATIDQEVANTYNDGIVRCINEDCAKCLYACFRSYSTGPIQDFLTCGSHAARLNDNKMVVPPSL